MIELLRIHAIVRMAHVLVFIGRAAEFVRVVACRKAGAPVIERVTPLGASGEMKAARPAGGGPEAPPPGPPRDVIARGSSRCWKIFQIAVFVFAAGWISNNGDPKVGGYAIGIMAFFATAFATLFLGDRLHQAFMAFPKRQRPVAGRRKCPEDFPSDFFCCLWRLSLQPSAKE